MSSCAVPSFTRDLLVDPMNLTLAKRFHLSLAMDLRVLPLRKLKRKKAGTLSKTRESARWVRCRYALHLRRLCLREVAGHAPGMSVC